MDGASIVMLRSGIKGEVELYLNEARDNPSWLGKEITDPKQLNNDVIKFIEQNL